MRTHIILTNNKHAYARMRDGVFEVKIPKWMPVSRHEEIIRALLAKYPKDRPARHNIFDMVREQKKIDWAYGDVEQLSEEVCRLPEKEFRRYLLLRARKLWQSALDADLRAFCITMRAKRTLVKVDIRDLRSRWGSCTPTGNITISLALFLVPYPLFAYVCAHEVAHLTHLHHGESFWQHLCDTMPDARERRKQLHMFQIS